MTAGKGMVFSAVPIIWTGLLISLCFTDFTKVFNSLDKTFFFSFQVIIFTFECSYFTLSLKDLPKSLFGSVFATKRQEVKVLESFLKHVFSTKTFIKYSVV